MILGLKGLREHITIFVLFLRLRSILATIQPKFSKLYFKNSLSCGLPQHEISRLQSVHNAFDRVIACLKKYDHITETFRELHCLLVEQGNTESRKNRAQKRVFPNGTLDRKIRQAGENYCKYLILIVKVFSL